MQTMNQLDSPPVRPLSSVKILIMGLPGAGKTTLARLLRPLIGAVLFNADDVRANINKDLGFTAQDRIEQARRMGWLCDRVVEAGGVAIADFVCPTPQTREAFGDAFIIFMDRIESGRFEDTNRLFQAPERYDVRIGPDLSPEDSAKLVLTELRHAFSDGAAGQHAPEPEANKAQFSRSDFAWWLTLSCAVVGVRGMTDALPWEGLNIAIHMLVLGVVFYFGGRLAAFSAWIATLCADYLLIAPTYSLGVRTTSAALELLIWQFGIAGLTIAIIRGLRNPGKRLI